MFDQKHETNSVRIVSCRLQREDETGTALFAEQTIGGLSDWKLMGRIISQSFHPAKVITWHKVGQSQWATGGELFQRIDRGGHVRNSNTVWLPGAEGHTCFYLYLGVQLIWIVPPSRNLPVMVTEIRARYTASTMKTSMRHCQSVTWTVTS